MKSIYRACIILLYATGVWAQNPVPNPSFESWSGGQPEGWYINNVAGADALTQTGDANSGSSAIKGEVVTFLNGVLVPVTWSGTISNQFFPVSVRYAQLSGYYKFHAAAAVDSFVVGVQVANANRAPIGAGGARLGPASSFTQFTIDLVYSSGEPAMANITMGIDDPEGTNASLGSYFIVDDLELSGMVTSVAGPELPLPGAFVLHQNYPNPFNPATTFSFTLPRAGDVKLAVFNQRGQEVARVADDYFTAGSYKIQWQAGELASGVYYYKLNAGEQQLTRKLLLLK